MVLAREPKVNVINLDSCIGTEAPVDADTRPLELRQKDKEDADAAAAAKAKAEAAAAKESATAKETVSEGSGSSRSLNAASRSAYVEEMKPLAAHEDGWLW